MNDTKKYDVAIVGGGIMGCSTAYSLMRADDNLKVAVIERDPTYLQASTSLSVGNVRIQFTLKENIQISQYTLEVLERFEEDMAINGDKPYISRHSDGNLFLVTEEHRNKALEALALQESLGCQVEWLSTEQIKKRYPLYDPTGLAGGTYSPHDTQMDGYGFLMGYKTKARSLGVEFIKNEVYEVIKVDGRVTGVRLASGETVESRFVVNCAGAWASQVAQTVGIKLPVVPVKRQVFAVDTAYKPKKKLPGTVFPSSLYFLMDINGSLLVSKSLAQDPIGFDFTCDHGIFKDVLWPELARFVPVFDALKLIRGWAGLYAVNTFDGNAILGEWPGIRGFFLANGFSGHGLQQAPAVGRYISELIIGGTPTLDLSIFSPERILENKPIREHGLV